MKRKATTLLMLVLGAGLLQGCISIPPLIKIEHRDGNTEVLHRLDRIDQRLDDIERRLTPPPPRT